MDEDFEPPEVAYSEERPLTSNLPDDVITPMGQVDVRRIRPGPRP